MTETLKIDSLIPQPSDQSLSRFQESGPQWLQSVREISVLDDASYVQVCEYKLAGQALLKTLLAVTDQIKRTHKTALESAIIPWERVMAPIEEGIALAEQKRKAYRVAQELRVQADAAAAIAEQRRIAEEQKRRNAAMLEAAGHDAAAKAVRETPTQIAPVPIPKVVPKVKGIRDVKTWKVKVTDRKLLIRAVGAALILASEDLRLDPFTQNVLRVLANGVTPEALACLFDKDGDPANLHWLRDRARQQQEAFTMPGVSAWQE